MNKDLFSVINEKLPAFSKGHKLIANYILAHYDKAAFMTAQKLGKTVGVTEIETVGVDVLPQETDLPVVLCLQFPQFGEDVADAAGAFLAAGIGHDAVGAELVAAIHDIDISLAGAGASDRQIFDDPALFRKNFNNSFM